MTLAQVDHDMLLILSLDPNASLRYSTYTQKWYVESSIYITDSCMLSGKAQHRETVGEAVSAFLARLISISLDESIVTNATRPNRRHHRWNGAAFVEEPLPESVRA